MPTPPDSSIQTRRLAVYYQEARGRGSTLVYLPAALGDEAAPREYKEIARQTLTEDLDDVRTAVDRLTGLAVMGRGRGDVGIESVARRLAAHVLPAGFLERCMGPLLHPRFDIGPDLAAGIPWEVLEAQTSKCDCATPTPEPVAVGQPCPQCGQPFALHPHPLALTYHLSHLVPGSSAARQAGRTFLLVHDPTGDLCERDSSPDHVCALHVTVLSDLLRQAGFEVDLLSHQHATRAHFRDALRCPDLAGLYFFGHGCLPREGDEGFLRLADGEMVASALEELDLTIPFVFLNACEGAATSRDWDLDRRNRNVACAFARGPGRAVIAPLWPVVNVQAAQTALEVFRAALNSLPLAMALRQARQQSHDAYTAGAPNLAWIAYRYFGNPNQPLVGPAPTLEIHQASAPSTPLTPDPGDLSGRLDVETFAFDLEGILLRAAKRKNLHGRTQATITDLIAGLIRRGDLTRSLLRSLERDPDNLYQRILARKEPAVSTPGTSDGPDTHSDWMLRTPEQFTPETWRVLTDPGADPAPATPSPTAPVPESDLLQRVLQDQVWSTHQDLGLPDAAAIQRVLREKLANREIDANGAVPLDDIDPAARAVVQIAHRLAQHRGLFPIPHRLVLAAMLCHSGLFATRLCRRLGGDPEALLALMLASTEAEPDTPRENAGLAFGLTPEACSRIIIPMLGEARRRTPDGAPLAEATVVQAFCAVANPAFKQAIHSVLPTVVLDDWPRFSSGILDLAEPLDATAWQVLVAARDLTDNRGIPQIPNRLFLAAFLSRPNAPAPRALRLPETTRLALYTLLLESLPLQGTGCLTLDPNTCARSIGPAIELACAQAEGRTVNEWRLFKAFCQVMEPRLKTALHGPPWNLDLDQLPANPPAATVNRPPGASPPNLVSDSRQTSPPALAPPAADGRDLSVLTLPGPVRRGLNSDALAVLDHAGRLALEQGLTSLRTPHLWAALISDEQGPLGAFLRRHSLALPDLREAVLRLTALPPGFEPARDLKPLAAGRNVLQTLNLARVIASGTGRQTADPSDLLRALLADTSHPVHYALRDLGLNLSALHQDVASRHRPPGSPPATDPWSNN